MSEFPSFELRSEPDGQPDDGTNPAYLEIAIVRGDISPRVWVLPLTFLRRSSSSQMASVSPMRLPGCLRVMMRLGTALQPSLGSRWT